GHIGTGSGGMAGITRRRGSAKNILSLRTWIVFLGDRCKRGRGIFSIDIGLHTHYIAPWYKTAGYQNRPGWPSLVVHFAYPVEKGNKIDNFFFAQILLGH